MHPVLGSPSDEPTWPHNLGQRMQGGLLGSVFLPLGKGGRHGKSLAAQLRPAAPGVSPGTREVHAQLTARHSPTLCAGKAQAGSRGSWDLLARKRCLSGPPASCTEAPST